MSMRHAMSMAPLAPPPPTPGSATEKYKSGYAKPHVTWQTNIPNRGV